MEKKRSKGILVYSVLFIFIGLLISLSSIRGFMMLNMSEEGLKQYYAKQPYLRQANTNMPDKFKPENFAQTQYKLQQEMKKQTPFLLTYLAIFIYLCLIAVSIGLLKLKKWASKIIPTLSIIATLQTIIGSYFFFIKSAPILKKYFLDMPFGQFFQPLMMYITAFSTAGYLILFLSSAYYFTRPNVKEQFK